LRLNIVLQFGCFFGRKTIVTQNSVLSLGTNTNSVYQNFAQNLFNLATRGSTIAQTCRDLNINRQQFNKYLSGAVLPNAETLRRIAEHFKIDALVLFGSSDGFNPVEAPLLDEKPDPLTIWRSKFEEFINQLKTQNTPYAISEGVYNFYHVFPPDTARVVRGILVFRKIDGLMFFTRIVGFRSNATTAFLSKVMITDGIASQEASRVSLVGRTRYGEQNLRMLSIDTAFKTPGGYFVGLMMINNPQGRPLAVKLAMKYEGTVLEWRKFFRNSGIFNSNSPYLPAEVLRMTDLGFNSDSGLILSPDLTSEWKKI
jgi:transcriptional regulator with XRE-family HTH domain